MDRWQDDEKDYYPGGEEKEEEQNGEAAPKKKKKKKKSKSSKKPKATSMNDSSSNNNAGAIGEDKHRIRDQKLQYIQQDEENPQNRDGPFMSEGETTPGEAPSESRSSSNSNSKTRNRQSARGDWRAQPGAFRIHFRRRQSGGGGGEPPAAAETTPRRPPSSSSLRQQQQQVPLAHVEPMGGTEQEDDAEIYHLEAHPQSEVQQKRRNNKNDEDDCSFWVMAALLIGVVVLASVLTVTLVVIRRNRETGEDISNDSAPTVAPENGFETNPAVLKELWDEYSRLFLYSVQFGFHRGECTSPAAPELTMVCSTNSVIGIVALKYFNTSGDEIDSTPYYSCESTSPQQDALDCLASPVNSVKRPTLIWLVGCATNEDKAILRVEAAYDLRTTLSGDGATCDINQEQSHISYSMSMGQFCEEGFEPSVVCIEGTENQVNVSVSDKSIPFCGQIESCENTNGEACSIAEVGPLHMRNDFNPKCRLMKNNNQAFLDRFSTSESWDQTTGTFKIHQFGSKTHTVLINS